MIGGYGMGFTYRAALECLPPEGRVVVAEIVPEILDWAHGPMAALTRDALNDRRGTVALRDVADMIDQAASGERYDAILLYVDNGPDGIVRAANDRLYTRTRRSIPRHSGGVVRRA